MPEAICKLQPHRTMALQGFDDYGAAAALWGASDTGFTVSGVFRDMGDFAVLVLFQKHDPFGHPSFSYLPNGDLTGLTLDFDVVWQGIQSWESKKNAWTDWVSLDCSVNGVGSNSAKWFGTPGITVTPNTMGRASASSTFTLRWIAPQPGDKVTLWYQNLPFTSPAITGTSTVADVLNSIASQINGTNWTTNGPVELLATVSGNQLTVYAPPGADGNMVAFYQTDNTGGARLYFTASSWSLGGGSSDNVSWHVHVDFSVLGWNDVDEVWWTIAPALPAGAAYQPTEWQLVVTNWTVAGSAGKRPLKVAGPGSVRIEEDDTSWVSTTGYWEQAPGEDPVNGGFCFWSQGRAIRAAASGCTITIETHCQATHNIYVGTKLDTNCGIVSATLDGGAPVMLDCYYPTPTTTQTRRLLFAGVAAGSHTVVITLTGTKNAASEGWYFHFDFLECAVLSDVPDPAATTTAVGMATDYDTDNTYKLSPQRLIWNLQNLGMLGEIDHYCGVFWWKQAVAHNPVYPQCTVTFTGDWSDQDVVWLHIGGSAIGKTVFGGQDTNSTIAQHFANFINAVFDGVWASASGDVLTITSHSFGPIWQYHVTTQLGANHGTGAATVTGDMQGGTYGTTWRIDPTQTPVFNRAFRDWNADFFAAAKAAGLSVVCSFSQELVNPPEDPFAPSVAGSVWLQRFPDGAAVQTATGFGGLTSSQIAFSSGPQTYMQQAFAEIASMMVTAGLTPKLQFGEILWWFQQNPSGMAFCDADTVAAAQAALGRPLDVFLTPNDDPSVNGYADADFLRTRLYEYVVAIQDYVRSQVPTAIFELLWPMDVNDPDNCRLLRYINLPAQWTTRDGSGFDTFMVEGYQYPGINHNLDQASRCAAYPFTELSWDQAHCRYLQGLYYATWPWMREFVNVSLLGIPLVKLWAYDHVCLFGWPVPFPTNDDRSLIY